MNGVLSVYRAAWESMGLSRKEISLHLDTGQSRNNGVEFQLFHGHPTICQFHYAWTPLSASNLIFRSSRHRWVRLSVRARSREACYRNGTKINRTWALCPSPPTKAASSIMNSVICSVSFQNFRNAYRPISGLENPRLNTGYTMGLGKG